jgi:hypothetical protein
MTAESLLCELRNRGVEFVIDGSRLRYHPKSAVPENKRALLTRYKPDLIRLIVDSKVPPPSRWARCAAALLATIEDADQRADLRDAYEERAGILEYEAGLTREDADERAFHYLLEALA